MRLLTFGAAIALSFCTSLSAQAQATDFYKGKTIELIIGYPPGGSNDVYARLVAQHMGKHIAGTPNIVARNMPGAGSFVAANQVFNLSPKDGTVLALGAPTLALDEKLGTQGVRYKTAQLNWIGRASPLVNIVMIWKTVAVKTVADAQKTEVTLAGTGAGSTVSIYPSVMNNVLGTKYKLIMGYRGSNEAMLAMERGETEGHSTAWEALKTAHPDWVEHKDVAIPVQFSLNRISELPDVPTALEFAKTDEQKRILEAILAASEVGTAFFTSPGVPPERVELLRRAFDATVIDPEFIADAKKVRVSVDPLKGEDLQKLILKVSDLPPDLTEKVRTAYQQN
jgi:tripartite-type tricarboxylate transporter receptor subunit TctC